ncbi:MAG: MBL fold metallo-hydrolase RNA specificity domain-containing protein [Myxococcota bacterium]|nr:MBL fold metallo-hydrolase RNA specificity domain-containing protein [Myxococcota bacterium]
MRVKIFGLERERRCDVKVLNGFSAHADKDDLVAFAEAVRDAGPLTRVALVHGDPVPQRSLKEALEERGFPDVRVPAFRDEIRV